ncbi:MAG TPA: NAD(P)-binding domain-containing protein [Acidimicrobiia bacterium]|nr:NAD(P)-binding domain-containing protein [Acidimicrobiia bacterium]
MSSGTGSDAAYDLVVVGGNSGGLSVAIAAQSGGLGRVRILEPSSGVAYSDLIGEHQLDVGFGEPVTAIDVGAGGNLQITTIKGVYAARACVVAQRTNVDASGWTPPIDAALSDRIQVDRFAGQLVDQDILIVGSSDHAVELSAKAATAGARVVLAAGGMTPKKLSPIGQSMLRRLERERRATILFRSVPEKITEADGFPLACFADRRTPDLEFDKVIFASGRMPVTADTVGLTEAAASSGRVWLLGLPTGAEDGAPLLTAAAVVPELAGLFPQLKVATEEDGDGRGFEAVIEELRKEHYNATITYFEATHSDLWVLGVRPDNGDISHHPGQYASLGLGYWEKRIDDAEDVELDDRWDKLVRRSYSISHRIFDEHGYLAQERDATELEFYIVLVPPTPEHVPGLTPRLALKKPGDRIYLGPKVAGRYTLAPVTDPKGTVVFFATGTGEAPHNAMAVELLRKGHTGPILSAVTVRQMADLGYLEKNRELEARYPNFHYMPLPTREPGVPKRYIQDLITEDAFAKEYGVKLDPETTHVFMCGNPAMIGLPTDGENGELIYPKPTGVVEILTERGFTLDHRKVKGNLHFEEYW